MKRFSFASPVFTAALLLACTGASAQTPPQDAQARYEQEREKCMTNNPQDSLAT